MRRLLAPAGVLAAGPRGCKQEAKDILGIGPYRPFVALAVALALVALALALTAARRYAR